LYRLPASRATSSASWIGRHQWGECLQDLRSWPSSMPLHGNFSGPATRGRCERAWRAVGAEHDERLAGISTGHLHNLRSPKVQKTRTVELETRLSKIECETGTRMSSFASRGRILYCV